MKIAVLLLVVVIMMMGREADSKRFRGSVSVSWDKRQVKNSSYDEAAKDGVFTDEEIQSVFGVDENGLAEFKVKHDVNGDGVVEVGEYEMVNTINSIEKQNE